MRSRARRLAAAPGPREATPMKIDLVYIAKQNERILDESRRSGELASFQLIKLHSVPASQGRIA
jgi:hypothetical protein